ncbi:MAG: MFS transporter [Chloroflexales bacterium]|nr:MFS transporter [Chloroflexales bacterium]
MNTVNDPKPRIVTIAAVYLSGLLLGLVLILFPSAGPLFRNPALHGLSSSQFGVLFTPQTVMAIAAAFAAAAIAGRFGMKRVLLLGLGMITLSLALATLSHFVIGVGNLPFLTLLAATAGLGDGFGLGITALNAYAFDLFPGREDAAIVGIHVMTGIGQIGAALLLSLFTGGGANIAAWWGAPLSVAIIVILMMGFQSRLPLRLSSENQHDAARSAQSLKQLPPRIWVYVLIVFTYGAIEGTFGNFAPLYLQNSAGLTPADVAVGLSFFWGALTIGRVLFAALTLRLNTEPLYAITPVIIGAVFLLLSALKGTAPNFIALGAAGLALSFFFPYSISRASAEQPLLTAAVSGALVAALQLGIGFSGIVVGAANEQVALADIFRLSTVYAVILLSGVIYLNTRTVEKRMDERLPCPTLPCVQALEKKSP